MKVTSLLVLSLTTLAHGALRETHDAELQQGKQANGKDKLPVPPRRRLGRLNHGEVIPGSYIVVMKNTAERDVNDVANQYERSFRKPLRKILRNALRGFVFDNLTDEEAALLAADDDIRRVEKDRVVSLEAFDYTKDFHSAVFDVSKKAMSQNPDQATVDERQASGQLTPWGIERVNGGETYRGRNVAWILDSGVDLNHPDLNVEVENCFSVFSTLVDRTCMDRNGHGTHVAGTIAAKNNNLGVVGVAAGATVIPIKVLDRNGDGAASGVLAGLEWVAEHGSEGDVANLSLGGNPSPSLDQAVKAVARQGIKIVLAAGNSATPAGDMSPGRVDATNVYTVSAFDTFDRRAIFSNYGSPPIDYAAPGVEIRSTWSRGRYATLSGTSMAAPHVAGILLLDHFEEDGRIRGDAGESFSINEPILVNQKGILRT